jgi:predicted dehydrogenase
MPDWRRELQGRGGVLADLGTHLLSQTLPLFGGAAPVRVTTRASSRMSGAGVEDEALVLVDFEGGGLLKIESAFDRTLADDRDDVALLVVGTEAEVEARLLTGEGADEAQRMAPVVRSRTENGVTVRDLARLRTVGECHLALAEHVVEAVRLGGATPQAEIDDELLLMELLDAAYASANRNGEPVVLH